MPTHSDPHMAHTVEVRTELTVGQAEWRRDPRPVGYVALDRDGVHLGAAHRDDPVDRSARRPPTGIELVLEVDDLEAEHDRVLASGWPIEGPRQDRPWGLTDFRILDPAGHYLRITNRSAA